MLVLVCIALVVCFCALALRRAEAGPSAWQDAALVLAAAGAVCWWQVAAERSRARYRRALVWLGAGVLCFVGWGCAIAIIS